MAKMRKYRKAPKKSAPLSTHQKYDDHVKEVDQHNAKIVADKKKKESVISGYQKKKSKR